MALNQILLLGTKVNGLELIELHAIDKSLQHRLCIAKIAPYLHSIHKTWTITPGLHPTNP